VVQEGHSSKWQRNATLTYETITSIACLSFDRIISFTLMNPAAINGLVSGVPAGLPSAWRLYKSLVSIEIIDEDFIEQLLHHCKPYPEPHSVHVMDNTSFHHSERIREMCRDAGVILFYLPPYSPDLNPIEKFFCRAQSLYQETVA